MTLFSIKMSRIEGFHCRHEHVAGERLEEVVLGMMVHLALYPSHLSLFIDERPGYEAAVHS